MPSRKRAGRMGTSAYDSLIEAERTALLHAGQKAGRNDLIRALIDATGLPPRAARRAVLGYIDRRDGIIPATTPITEARTGWLDDLLDAERARAARADQSVTPRTLLRAVHQASPDLSRRAARDAVADYLHRRGGRTLRPGRWRVIGLGLLGLATALLAAVWLIRG